MTEMDFGAFVTARRHGVPPDAAGGDRYAYSVDLRLLKAMRKMHAVESAVAAVVRLGETVTSGELLGTSVRVGEQQYPAVHESLRACARTLGITAPELFLQGRHDVMNAYTTGTERQALIVVHAALLERFSPEELRFVIGHECGHVQNGHVIHLTTLTLLTRFAGQLLGRILLPAVEPALLALQAWSRAAEITCDRAGLLCCGDLAVAERAFLKLVTGGGRMFAELNVDAYLAQLDPDRKPLERAAELRQSHPFIAKRIAALRVFAESVVYRSSIGLQGGKSMAEVDAAVEKIVKVL